MLEKAAAFQPRAILYVAHPEDSDRVVRLLVQSIRARRILPYAELTALVQEAGVNAEMPERLLTQRLSPLGDRIMSWIYRRIVADSQRAGMAAGYIFLPMVPEMRYSGDVTRQIEAARASGFVVFDLSNVYDGTDRTSLWLTEWDAHPNAAGHRMIADRLYTLLEQNGDWPVGAAGDPRLRATR